MSQSNRIGKYEILDEIGRGGFATVYRARDTRLNRVVALKVLHPYRSAEPGFVERFRHEAEVAANLDHPNIVAVYEADEADGRLYLAMKYVHGRTLREMVQTDGASSPEKTLPILEQIASALDYAHRQGIVHRDIKPSNIIIDGTGEGSRVTVLDFGLVKALEGSTELTRTGTLLGSPEYMAPEQADPNRAKEISPATDRYALGIVAYQMLTGRVPFPGDTSATLNAHLNLNPPDPHTLRTEVSPQAAAVLLKMLAKVPADRYTSAGEFVLALRAATQAPAPAVPAKRAEAEQSRRQERPVPSSIREVPRKTPRWMWGALLSILAMIGVGVVVSAISSRLAEPSLPALVLTQTPLVVTITPVPTRQATSAATAPPTIAPTPTPSSNLRAGRTMQRATDGAIMVYVTNGIFKMGSGSGGESDEKPAHDVTLDGFWIDRTEVTNAQYLRCVSAGKCSAPAQSNSFTRRLYYGNVRYAEYPVLFVSWDDANNYCAWAGGRLPTEAQWEYAARGPQGYTYPWGNDPPNDMLLNFNRKADDTTAVGSYPSGASWVGAFDLSGNVWEWVQDWYGPYPASSQTSPVGPVAGDYKVLRGGSWTDDGGLMRSALRHHDKPDLRNGNIGFRCAAAVPSE